MHAITKILLIEDSPFDAHVFKSVLKRTRDFKLAEVDIASSLAEAAAMIKGASYPLIMLDLKLPDGQGIQLVHEILRLSHESPIIVLTGLEAPEIANKAISAGAQDYLVKGDFTPAILGRTIRYALQRHEVLVRNQNLCNDLKSKEQELRKQNEMLKKAVNLANEFVDNVSHEFRTPLTVILDHASILKEGMFGELEDRQLQMINKIIDRSEDLNSMVNDMLDSSRINAGILGFQREPARLIEIFERCQSALELKANLRQVELIIDVPHDLPDIFCDPEKVVRTITNLAGNAIKFCGNPGRVEIDVEHRPAHRDVIVHVKDNGDGLTEKEQEIITKRFSQVGGTSSSSQGFGLGLSIVKELVDLNFGELVIDSEVGLGTTFSFTVPVCDTYEVMNRYLKSLNSVGSKTELTMYFAHILDSHSSQENRELNALWKYLQHKDDLVFEVNTGMWVLILANREDISEDFKEVVTQTVESLNHKRISPMPDFVLSPQETFQIPFQIPLIFERTFEFLQYNAETQPEFQISETEQGVYYE